jgi:hypothetical protein
MPGDQTSEECHIWRLEMKFVIVASILLFAMVAPASGDVAPPDWYWSHHGCRWFCQEHGQEQSAPIEQASEEQESEAQPPGEASSQEGTATTREGETAAAEEEGEQPPVEQPPVEGAQTEAAHVENSKRGKPPEEPKPGSMWVGVNGGGWGPSEPREIAPMVKYVRLESGNPNEFASFQASGISVDWDDWGPYVHGVSSINDAAYASHLVSVIEADPSIVSVEVLNEPDGDWFWGAEANSRANAEAYAQLLEVVYKRVKARFGSEHPLLLGAFEEGSTWGDVWWNALKNKSAVDGVVVHPYGGTGSRAQSALGNRGQVERAYSYTSKPVFVTEVGWPTAQGFPQTGDSLQWSQREQAQNIYSFVNWARSTGYVGGVFIYGYHDAESNGPAEYGVVTHSGVKKDGWTALKEVAEGVACAICR